MSDTVTTRRDGSIAFVMIDNPPLNLLNHRVRTELKKSIELLACDPVVQAAVLTGNGRMFCAGADVTEFHVVGGHPTLIELIAVVEALPKPVIAAIHGAALGGGLELALACHFRVATATARLGTPEIKLGLIPGAGGTQRLPRLIGVEEALKMILGGEPIDGETALRIGLIDSIAHGDLLADAAAFARHVQTRPPRRLRDIRMRHGTGEFDAMARAAHGIARPALGHKATAAAIDAVSLSFEMPFDAALQRERILFDDLLAGDESKALRHLFFAEREAARVPGIPADIVPTEIKLVAIIGAGAMGARIALCFARAGIPVRLIDNDAGALTRANETIAARFRRLVQRGSMSLEEAKQARGAIESGTHLESIGDADLVIEAVTEDIDVKLDVFQNLARLCKPSAILASNTSYLDLDTIAAATCRPESVVGLHFFNPADIMRLTEVVRGVRTTPAVIVTTAALCRRLGKLPVVVNACPGFVGNRMLLARSIELERLLIEGALPQDVDRAVLDFGFPMGPFAMADLSGLDIEWRGRKARGEHADIADALCELKRFGRKSGRGYFRYESGERRAHPDAVVEELIFACAKRQRIPRRSISSAEIIERLIYPMISEAARILDDGIAARPGDIDVVWVHGYGWPAWRGGPVHYADAVGLPLICDRLEIFAAQSNDLRLKPAALLQRLAKEGGRLADVDRR